MTKTGDIGKTFSWLENLPVLQGLGTQIRKLIGQYKLMFLTTATARCCKSAAPANLTMLQHCTVKQIQHFKLANLPCCTDTASFQLVAKQSCHLARLQRCKSNVQHCKPVKSTKSSGQTTPTFWPKVPSYTKMLNVLDCLWLLCGCCGCGCWLLWLLCGCLWLLWL